MSDRAWTVVLALLLAGVLGLLAGTVHHGIGRNRDIAARNRRVVKECKITPWRRLSSGKYQDVEAKWKCPDDSEFWLQAPNNEWRLSP